MSALFLLKAEQLSLFDTVVSVKPHVKKDGTAVRGHTARRKVARKPDVPPAAMTDDEVIDRALEVLRGRLRDTGAVHQFESPDAVKNYLRLRVADREHEVFGMLMMDTRHRLIEDVEMFRGTIDGASVHPREVVKEAIRWNAAAVIFAHNHPSGVAEPSQADLRITKRLQDALNLIDVRVLDHIIVGEQDGTSFAERGLI